MANKANKGSFNWYEIVLKEGWEVYSTRAFQYAKNDLNCVHLLGTIKKATKPIAGEIIGVLPEGFRPLFAVVASTFIFTAQGLIVTAFRLETNGNLLVHPNQSQLQLDSYSIGTGININYYFPAQ